MNVYDDFYYYTGGVYTHTSGNLAGAHAVLLVGYDDAGQYFTVKNSWGTGWGEAGYFKIAYSEVKSVVNFGDWTIAYTGAAPTCTYALSSTSASADDAGATGSVNITASSTACNWTATSNATWISISSGASGTGNGAIYYAVAANTETVTRTGTMTIAGQTVTVTQEGPSCSFLVKQSFPASGGTGSLRVNAGTGCNWQSSPSDPWITITQGQTGTGSGKLNFSVSANTGSSPREGALTVAGTAWPIYQEATQTCTYGLSPSSQSFTSGAGTGSVNVTGATGCAWNAKSNVNWITVTSGLSGTGSGTIYYSVTANTASTRTGTMTIAGQTFTVSQAGANSGNPKIDVSTPFVVFRGVAAGTSASKSFTVSNTGVGTLTVTSVSLTGSDGSLSESTDCSIVAPGGTCMVTITFAPRSAGSTSGNVSIYSNDPDSGVVTLSVWAYAQ
jgi:hypothetical protein